MAKSTKPETSAPPTSYPATPPPPSLGADLGGWLLNASTKTEGALGKVEATLISLQSQLTRIESKLTEVEKEVHGHGRWMHTLKVFAGVMTLIIGWIFVNAIWPWLRTKMGIPAATP